MLALPEAGFQRSVEKHNVDLMSLTDWIEASLLFADATISKTDVVDVLCEESIYTDQDFALEIVDSSWVQLQRRCQWMGDGASIDVGGRRVEMALSTWEDNPAHSFCMALTLAGYYKNWSKSFGSDYNAQGDLFEELTSEALLKLGWDVHPTGWATATRSRSSTDLTVIRDVIQSIADKLDEIPGNLDVWLRDSANDAGLDLIFLKPFLDGRVGRPVYFAQCASGGNWKQKLDHPRLQVWRKLIDFTIGPQRAFAMPFSLDDDEFKKNSVTVEGILLDRYRILSAGHEDKNWVSNSLSKRIIDWLQPRVTTLPKSGH